MKNITIIVLTIFFYAFAQENTEIINKSMLYPFFEKLKNIEKYKKVNILHIGDSHVQGNFFSSIVRKTLQDEFGNGGIGFVFPYNLAKTNSETNKFAVWSSQDSWNSCRISKKSGCSPQMVFGISGYGLAAENNNFEISLEVPEYYKFDQITLFYPNETPPFSLKNDLCAANLIGIVSENKFFAKYQSPAPMTNLHIFRNNNYSCCKNYNNYNFHGAFLENDSAGIIYSSIGVNGAKAVDFVQNSMFFEQILAIAPDLLIVSFGTNEAFSDISPEVFVSQIETLISKVREKCGEIPVLITTPPISFTKKNETNFIHQYSKDINKTKHYAVWDLHKLTHDLLSEKNEYSFLAKDKIHYSADGYRYTAVFFANAILENYKSFLENMNSK
jgi:lysophospholipase L1-like esterase